MTRDFIKKTSLFFLARDIFYLDPIDNNNKNLFAFIGGCAAGVVVMLILLYMFRGSGSLLPQGVSGLLCYLI
jgi:hypothetical protein